MASDRLLAERRRLAKQANQRMLRLERGQSYLHPGENLTGTVYEIAQTYLAKQGKFGKDGKGARFSESLKQAPDKDIKDEIRQLKKFLESQTSTVKGFHEYEKGRAEYIAELLGRERTEWSKMTANDKQFLTGFMDWIKSETYKDLQKVYSSGEVVEQYKRASQAGASEQEILDKFEEYRTNPPKDFRTIERAFGRMTRKKRRRKRK